MQPDIEQQTLEERVTTLESVVSRLLSRLESAERDIVDLEYKARNPDG